jgi:transcriptional regulator GlxA family with amidase domain
MIKDVNHTDLIIVPAVNGDRQEVIKANKDFFPWIVDHYNKGTEVASLCVGAFLLASTGLVNGRKCSTHWLAANEFRELFPDVNLVPDRIITDEHGIYTSGGANSFWNLLLHLLEKYTDRETAIHAAKYFEIEIDRYSQNSFVVFNGQRDHQDEPVPQKPRKKVQESYPQHRI